MNFRYAFTLFAFSLCGSTGFARAWIDATGAVIQGEMTRFEDGILHLQLESGQIAQIPIANLSARDQAFLKGNGGSQSSGDELEARVARATARIDAAVSAGLEAKDLVYNEGLNDHMFLRRVSLDLGGRIPRYEEARAFLDSRHPAKRQQLLVKILRSEDHVSHFYNYLADLLRIQATVPGEALRLEPFQAWLKAQIRQNRPFDDLVRTMISAEGRIWENPAVGYHLRDNGMKLDHVSFTTKVFLGTDISCAQCHDHPFEEWTQNEYYELAAFFSDLETTANLPKKYQINRDQFTNTIAQRLKLKANNTKVRQATNRYFRAYRELLAANQLTVRTVPNQQLRLPATYEYDDAKPSSVVKPRTLFGDEASGKGPRRKQLADWLVSPNNPRFAMNIANRMWAHFFGRGVAEPLHDIDPGTVSNKELLKVLSEEMVSLDYDLRAFTWAIVNTKAYNRLATRTKPDSSKPYNFNGPILRRMTAEQTWDSMLTLMMANPNQFRSGNGAGYNQLINLISTGPKTPDQVYGRIGRYMNFKPANQLKTGTGKSIVEIANVDLKKGQKPKDFQRAGLLIKDARNRGMTLARASELPQPAPQEHFLQKFGQSERTFVVGANSLEGSVPQIMELMNGYATEILTKPNSRIFLRMKREPDLAKRADIVFLSILTRQMRTSERKLLLNQLKRGDSAYSDLIWALLNTPEFLFIK